MAASTGTAVHEHPRGGTPGSGAAGASPARRPPGPRWRPWRGRPEDPSWARPALLALLAATAVLYGAGLSTSGDANSFYAAAVQAGTRSWKAFFFGSSDASSFITVDKPPASLWVMELSGRVFGFSSWSLLLPQAVEGVAAVAFLHAAVRRWSGPVAGLVAGALLATTPVAALMFRFDNPDAALTLLAVVAAWCSVRAVESGRTGWVVGAGAALGGAFLSKTLEALLVLPALALVVLVAAPTPLRRRVGALLAGGAALVVSAGWWVATVQLWPAGSRPFIGGSTTNSELQLIVGYNGVGRLTGNERGGGSFSRTAGSAGRVAGGTGFDRAGTGGAGFGSTGFGSGGAGRGGVTARFGGGRGGGFGGSTGITRLFGSQMGTQVSWLLPAALLGLLVLLWWTRRAPRTDRVRAGALLWGTWLVVAGAVFSFAKGTIHSYYTVLLAPAVAALVAVALRELWARRTARSARAVAAVALVVTAGWALVLLSRAGWQPWLRPVVLVSGLLAAALVLLGPLVGRGERPDDDGRDVLGGSGAADRAGGAGARRRRAVVGAGAAAGVLAAVAALASPVAYAVDTAATAHTGSSPSAGPGGQAAGGFGGGFGGSSGATGRTGASTAAGRRTTTADPALVALLAADHGAHRWAAAVSGSMAAAPLQLGSGEPVMAMGGFSGSDPTPTLAQFERYVAAGDVHYYVQAASGGFGAGRGASATITAWVQAHFAARTVGADTVYDLTAPRT